MEQIKPLKRFGQNYLIDENIINKIIREIEPQKDDNLIEIGPGTGSLTEKLFQYNRSFTAVEVDRRVIENLSAKFPSLNLIEGDFLELDLKQLYKNKKKKIRIVGNIPYNLTSSVLFKLIDNSDLVQDSVLMVQYEVAKRMKASKGSKDYGILTVLLSKFADVEFCFKVPPAVFSPKPKVYSAVVHLHFKESALKDEMKEIFIKIVKAAFGNRRKILKNSLANSIFRHINFESAEVDINKRAEQLNVEDFVLLAEFVKERS